MYYVTDVLEDQWLKATVRALLWFYVLAFVKIVKFDFHRRPGDLKYVPAMILWGWVHSVIIKVWALFTINQVGTGFYSISETAYHSGPLLMGKRADILGIPRRSGF